jgi:hypothetical protein
MVDYFCDRDAVAPGQGSEWRCLFLEHMDTTLRHELSRRRGLFVRRMAIRVFRDVRLGVKRLHDVGIVHMVN